MGSSYHDAKESAGHSEERRHLINLLKTNDSSALIKLIGELSNSRDQIVVINVANEFAEILKDDSQIKLIPDKKFIHILVRLAIKADNASLLDLLIDKYKVDLFEPYPQISNFLGTSYTFAFGPGYFPGLRAAFEIAAKPTFPISKKLLSLLLAKDKKLIGWRSGEGPEETTVLHVAAQSQNLNLVSTICGSKEGDVNKVNEQKESALHLAVVDDREGSIIQKLIKAGANVHQQNKRGFTPIMEMVIEGYAHPSYADSKREEQRVQKNLAIFHRVSGVTINTLIPDRDRAPLHLVTDMNPQDFHNSNAALAVKIFLSAGADVDIRNKEGFTAFRFAVERGNEAAFVLLINAGADVNLEDNVGRTPFLVAFDKQPMMALHILEHNIQKRQFTAVAKDFLKISKEQFSQVESYDNLVKEGIKYRDGLANGLAEYLSELKLRKDPNLGKIVSDVIDNNNILGKILHERSGKIGFGQLRAESHHIRNLRDKYTAEIKAYKEHDKKQAEQKVITPKKQNQPSLFYPQQPAVHAVIESSQRLEVVKDEKSKEKIAVTDTKAAIPSVRVTPLKTHIDKARLGEATSINYLMLYYKTKKQYKEAILWQLIGAIKNTKDNIYKKTQAYIEQIQKENKPGSDLEKFARLSEWFSTDYLAALIGKDEHLSRLDMHKLMQHESDVFICLMALLKLKEELAPSVDDFDKHEEASSEFNSVIISMLKETGLSESDAIHELARLDTKFFQLIQDTDAKKIAAKQKVSQQTVSGSAPPPAKKEPTQEKPKVEIQAHTPAQGQTLFAQKTVSGVTPAAAEPEVNADAASTKHPPKSKPNGRKPIIL